MSAPPPTVDSLLDAGDAIGALCLAVKEAGLTMTLHGKPIDADGLRDAGMRSLVDRIFAASIGAMYVNHDPGDEDPNERPLS